MNGYNRCGGHHGAMMYAMPAVPVKTEVVTVPTQACDMKAMPTQVNQMDSQMPTPMCAPMPTAYQMPAPMCAPMCGPMQFESCQQVVEPTVCCMPEVHHHHKVEHIVPVVVRNVHHHHNHHDYVICKQEGMETHQYDHGLRNEDWCALAMQHNSCGPTKPMC